MTTKHTTYYQICYRNGAGLYPSTFVTAFEAIERLNENIDIILASINEPASSLIIVCTHVIRYIDGDNFISEYRQRSLFATLKLNERYHFTMEVVSQ